MSQLVVEHLRKTYSTPADDLVVLDDVSFALDASENLAIVGPSGTGKSTLLQIIGTLDTPTSGSIRFLNKDPFLFSENELASFRNRHIGFVFQDHHLLPQLSVLENILIPVLATRSPDKVILDRAAELLERVGLSNRSTHLPSELSGGERERVAVARALILRPSLILADEPTGNLDADNASLIGKLLLELQRQENIMLIVVTHSEELAATMKRRVRLERGRVTEC